MILSKLTAMILSSTLLSGCANWDATSTQTDVQAQLADACTTHIVNYTETDTAPNWQTSDYTSIICNGSEAEISGNGAASDANGITISQAGTYVLSGTLTDGTLTIDAPSDALVTVVLNGVSLSCSDSAPFYAKQADKTVVVLANGTENILSDGEIYQYPDPETDEPNAALFSKDDLTITGSGMLTVLGQYNNGIGTKDDLKITDGTITVISTDDGLVGKDSVGISGGTISINAQ